LGEFREKFFIRVFRPVREIRVEKRINSTTLSSNGNFRAKRASFHKKELP